MSARYETALLGLLGATVLGSVLAIGAVLRPALLVVGVLAAVSAICAMAPRATRAGRAAIPTPGLVLLGLALFTLCQCVYMPIGWLVALAPSNADVWSRALLPSGEAVSWAPVSLDPPASVVEAFKWLTYAAVFMAATATASRRGAAPGITIVFGSAVVTALVTLGHDLIGATKVFGMYAPHTAVESRHLGPLLNPNNLAGYLNLGAFCGMGLLLKRRPTIPKWLSGLGVAALLAVEIRSGSRAGTAVLPAGMALLALLVWRARARRPDDARTSALLLLLGSWVGGATLALIGSTHAVARELFNEDMSKLTLATWTIPMIRDFPWIGIGRGAFESAFSAYRIVAGSHFVHTHAENFAIQWVCEWGAIVGVGALAALAWLFRPWRVGATKSALRAGAWVGVIVLCAQNLLDFGLEIPAVGVATSTVLGSLWGNARASRPSDTRRVLVSNVGALVAYAVSGLGLVVGAVIVVLGGNDIDDDRVELLAAHERVARATATPSDRDAFRRALRRQMLRHPADYYFPLVGASLAWRLRDQSPMPWLQRTLERAPINGRAHLLLADVLEGKGARAQALFELRLTAEYEPYLLEHTANRAAKWADTLEDVMRAAPSGVAGGAWFEAVGGRIGDRSALRRRCDTEAIGRNPGLVRARLRLANDLLEALAREDRTGSDEAPCADRAACERELMEHADALERARPNSSQGEQLRARILMVQGKPDDADRILATACSRPEDRASCLELRIHLVAAASDAVKLDAVLREYVSEGCMSRPSCAAAHSRVGDVRVRRQDWLGAAASYAKAATEDPSAERWLRAADAAERANLHVQAAEALERVAQQGQADDALRARIAKQRAAATQGLLHQRLDGDR